MLMTSECSKMIKGIFTAIIVLSLLALGGCSEISGLQKGLTDTSSSKGPKIIREAVLGSEWQMTQMQIEVEADDELSILLKLEDGDAVDGFFYLERGSTVNFQIIGDSLIYEPEAEDTPSAGVDSDRFSLVANQEQGTTYTLIFHNPADNGKVTIFLEAIYPATSSLFVPVGTK